MVWNVQQVQEVRQVLHFPWVLLLPERKDKKGLISTLSPHLCTTLLSKRSIYCYQSDQYLPDDLRSISPGCTHRGSRQSSLSRETSQSWGSVFTGASGGSRVSLGALLPWGTRKSLLSRWTWGSRVAALAHGAGLSWWTLGGWRWTGHRGEEDVGIEEKKRGCCYGNWYDLLYR